MEDIAQEIARLLEQRDAINARLQENETTYRRCVICQKWKQRTSENFARSGTGKGRLRSECKDCEREKALLRRQGYRAANATKKVYVYEQGETHFCSSHDHGKGAWLPLSRFSRNPSLKSGLSNQCKACKSSIILPDPAVYEPPPRRGSERARKEMG